VVELLKFVVFAGVLLGIMKGVDTLCRISARRWDISQKVLTNVVMVVVFLVSSYFYLFTGFPQWLSSVTGIPFEK
jgi:hypothetical protein